MTITLRIDSDSCSIAVFEEVKSNHTFGSKNAVNSDFFWCNGPKFFDWKEKKLPSQLSLTDVEFQSHIFETKKWIALPDSVNPVP